MVNIFEDALHTCKIMDAFPLSLLVICVKRQFYHQKRMDLPYAGL